MAGGALGLASGPRVWPRQGRAREAGEARRGAWQLQGRPARRSRVSVGVACPAGACSLQPVAQRAAPGHGSAGAAAQTIPYPPSWPHPHWPASPARGVVLPEPCPRPDPRDPGQGRHGEARLGRETRADESWAITNPWPGHGVVWTQFPEARGGSLCHRRAALLHARETLRAQQVGPAQVRTPHRILRNAARTGPARPDRRLSARIERSGILFR